MTVELIIAAIYIVGFIVLSVRFTQVAHKYEVGVSVHEIVFNAAIWPIMLALALLAAPVYITRRIVHGRWR